MINRHLHLSRVSLLAFLFLVTALSSCTPLQFKIFVRNLTSNTVFLTLQYGKSDYNKKTFDQARFADTILKVNNRTLKKLNNSLPYEIPGENSIKLALPPHSTVYLSDIINSVYLFTDKTLILQKGNKVDSIQMKYPYRRIKGIRRKLDPGYNFFYRTIIYYDIKDE